MRVGYRFDDTHYCSSDGNAGMVGKKEGMNVENSMGFAQDDSRSDNN